MSNNNTEEHLEDREKVEMGFVLDFNSDPIMFIDNHFMIKYTNYRALCLFQNHQEKFQNRWNDFNPNSLIGSYAQFLFEMTENYHNEIKNLGFGQSTLLEATVDDLYFRLRMAPIFNLQGERLGTSIELIDITKLINVKNILNQAIDDAKFGDFSSHSSIKYPEGESIFKDTFQKVNQLIFVLDKFMTELQIILDKLSQGDLKAQFDISNQQTKTSQSIFDLFKTDTNKTINQLNSSMGNLSHQIYMITEGIQKIWQNNFELVMHLQFENSDSKEIQNQIHHFLKNVRYNNFEINQAVTFLNSYSVEENKNQMNTFVDALMKSIHEVGHSTKGIINVTNTIKHILITHTKGLEQGLELIHNGSIGKGIKLVQSESQEILNKSSQSIHEINEMLTNINLKFTQSTSAVDDFTGQLSSNLEQIASFVSVLKIVFGEINDNISGQNSVFDNLAEYLEKMNLSKLKTIDTVENTIVNTVGMQEVVNATHEIMSFFKFDDTTEIEEFDKDSYISTIMNCIETVRQDIIQTTNES